MSNFLYVFQICIKVYGILGHVVVAHFCFHFCLPCINEKFFSCTKHLVHQTEHGQAFPVPRNTSTSNSMSYILFLTRSLEAGNRFSAFQIRILF